MKEICNSVYSSSISAHLSFSEVRAPYIHRSRQDFIKEVGFQVLVDSSFGYLGTVTICEWAICCLSDKERGENWHAAIAPTKRLYVCNLGFILFLFFFCRPGLRLIWLLTPLQRCSGYILQPHPTGLKKWKSISVRNGKNWLCETQVLLFALSPGTDYYSVCLLPRSYYAVWLKKVCISLYLFSLYSHPYYIICIHWRYSAERPGNPVNFLKYIFLYFLKVFLT